MVFRFAWPHYVFPTEFYPFCYSLTYLGGGCWGWGHWPFYLKCKFSILGKILPPTPQIKFDIKCSTPASCFPVKVSFLIKINKNIFLLFFSSERKPNHENSFLHAIYFFIFPFLVSIFTGNFTSASKSLSAGPPACKSYCSQITNYPWFTGQGTSLLQHFTKNPQWRVDWVAAWNYNKFSKMTGKEACCEERRQAKASVIEQDKV